MIRRISLALTLLSVPTLIAQVTPADVEAQKSATTPTNAQLVTALARTAASDLGKQAYAQAVGPAEVPPPSINQIAKETKQAISNHDFGGAILKGNELLIKESVTIGVSLGSNPVLGTIVGDLVSESLDKVHKVYDEEGRAAIARNLKTHLDEYRARTSEQEFNDLLASPNPDLFRQKLESKVGKVFGTDLDTLAPDQQQIVNSFYDRQVANLLTAGIATLSNFQTLQADQITQNKKDIKGLALALSEYAKQTDEKLTAIATTQQEMANGLQALTQRIGKTEQGVAFLQNMMFSKLSPGEQLAALRSGIFPDLPAADRQDLEEKIAVVAKRQELVDRVGSYLNGARDLTNIAANLGVDPSVVQKANQAVAIGQNAVAAFAAFSSGNYLAAISSVSNILGVGGPDVAGERHREIMNAFQAVFNQLHVMDLKLDEILRREALIIETQKAILENIAALSKQIQQDHEELLARLHELHTDVLFNRKLIVTEAAMHYFDCSEVISRNGVRILDTEHHKLPSPGEFGSLFLDDRERLINCMRQITDTRDAMGDFRTAIFALESYKDKPESNIGAYLSNVYQPAFTILGSTLLTADSKTLPTRVTSLFAPMDTVAGLNAKLPTVISDNPVRFKKPVAGLMPTALAIPAVVQHAQLACDIHYYYLLLDAFDQPRKLQDLFRADGIRMSGRDRLLEALSITDVAVAQETMLSGDAMLPLLVEVLQRFKTSNKPAEKALMDAANLLLNNDVVIARNLLLFGVRNNVEKTHNFSTYAVAFAGSDKATMQALVGDLWSLTFSAQDVLSGETVTTPKGWSATIGSKQVPLPSPEELVTGQLTQQGDLRQLLSLRRRLLDELSGYDIYLIAPAASRKDVNSMLLRQMATSKPAA